MPPAAAQNGGPWTTWLFLGGRGAGKTRAGAEWIRGAIAQGRARRIALVAETLADARNVMVEGPSGLLALDWRGLRPHFKPSLRQIQFGSRAVAHLFSAEDPDALRGYQFDHAWADELAKWPYVEETWDMLQFGLRLGDAPRQMVTTTPRPIPLLKRLLADPLTSITRARTADNAHNLAPGFLTHVVGRYEGTRLGRQELDAEIIDDNPDALFKRALIEDARVHTRGQLVRIVVAVDPPVTGGASADECGIIVAGLGADGHGYVIADASVKAGPSGWARAVVNAFRLYDADRVVAETNQGGDLVTLLLRQHEAALPLRKVHATRGKVLRAEPIAALYEQGRVHHVGAFPKLEDQMCDFAPTPQRGAAARGAKSPDRLDALVWALTDLMLTTKDGVPRIRSL